MRRLPYVIIIATLGILNVRLLFVIDEYKKREAQEQREALNRHDKATECISANCPVEPCNPEQERLISNCMDRIIVDKAKEFLNK